MNYDRGELLDQLAALYVLGVLRHRARARFSRLCVSSAAALDATRRWEDRLTPLAVELTPVTPSAACWTRIEQRIGGAGTGATTHTAPRRLARRWQLAIAASLVAVAILVGRGLIWPPTEWQPIAVLAPANAAPLWRVERDANATHINLRAMGAVTLAMSQSYELWALPVGEGKPVSLGVLPRQGHLERPLTPAQRHMLLTAEKIAVSIEPSGGSPTGLPTGPVVIVAPITHSS